MQKRGLVTVAAIGSVVVALAAGVAIKNMKRAEPLVSGPAAINRLAESQKLFFLPGYNGRQPNVISTSPTKKIAAFMTEVQKANPNVDWKDDYSTGVFLCNLLYAMKRNISTTDGAEMERYLEHAKKKGIVKADDFLKDSEVTCLERAIFLSAAMEQKGHVARVFLMEEVPREGKKNHAFVVLKQKDGLLILDPSYLLFCRTLNEYLSEYAKQNGGLESSKMGFLVYPALAYSSDYGVYLGSEAAEKKLEGSQKFVTGKLYFEVSGGQR